MSFYLVGCALYLGRIVLKLPHLVKISHQMYLGMTTSSCIPVINIWIWKMLLFFSCNWDFVINSLTMKLSKSDFECKSRPFVSVEDSNALIKTTVATLKRSKRKGIRNKYFVFFSHLCIGVLKLIMSVNAWYCVFFDIKKNPKSWLAHISTWGSTYEKIFEK